MRRMNLSVWLATLSILFFPGEVYTDDTNGVLKTEYGFPIRFFTQYHTLINENGWLIRDVNIQMLHFLLNVIIIYYMIKGTLYLVKKFRPIKADKSEK